MEKIFLYKNEINARFSDYLTPVYAKALRLFVVEKEIKEPLKEVLTASRLEIKGDERVIPLVSALFRCGFNKTEVEYLLDAIYAWREGEEANADEPDEVARPKKRKLQRLGVQTEKGAALDAVLFLSTDEGLALSERLFSWLDAVKELQSIDRVLEEDKFNNVYHKANVVQEYRDAANVVDEVKERLVSILKEQTGNEDKAERIVEALCKIYNVPEQCQ